MAVRNNFLRALSPQTFDQIKPRLHARKFPLGDTLFRRGDTIANVYFLNSGGISLVSELAGGHMVESAMIGSDSVVAGGAALDDGEAVYKAIVQVTGEGLVLDIAAARQMANDSEEFRRAIMGHEQMILAQAQQSAACNATHNLHERLARWLLRVRDATQSDSFELTQEFIAEMLGVGRSSVSLVAHALQEAGLINYSRGRIIIKNIEALRDSACECYETIKSNYDRLLQSSHKM